MSLFQIEAPTKGSISGVSAQAYVDPSAGAGRQLAANAITTLGGVGKEVYGGYVLSEMTDVDVQEDPEVARLTQAVDQGMSPQSAEALFRARYRTQSSMLAALGDNKERALKKAPWLSQQINSLYGNMANQMGEQDLFTKALDSQVSKLVADGAIMLSPTDTDEDLRWKTYQYNQNQMKMVQAEQAAQQSVADGLIAFSNQLPAYQENLMSQAMVIANRQDLSVTQRQLMIDGLQSSMISSLRPKYGFGKMSPEQRANYESSEGELIKALDLLKSDDILTGKIDLNALENQNKAIVQTAMKLGLQVPDTAAIIVSNQIYGDKATELLFNGTVSVTTLYNINKEISSQIASGTINVDPLLEMARGKVSSIEDSEVLLGLSTIGGMPQEAFDTYVSKISEKEAKRMLRDTSEYLSSNLEGTLQKGIDAYRLPQVVLEGIYLEEAESGKLLFKYNGEQKQPVELLMKLNRDFVPSITGAYRTLIASKQPKESALQYINSLIPKQRQYGITESNPQSPMMQRVRESKDVNFNFHPGVGGK